MRKNRQNTARDSAMSSKVIGSDLAKVDAHVIQPEEYDDAPEITEEALARADLYEGDKLIRRGRPPLEAPKQAIKLRLDADVIEHFRETGPGWQTRINETLRRVAKVKQKPRTRIKVKQKTGKPATVLSAAARKAAARKAALKKARDQPAKRHASARKRA
jgi:uncharacterized protein (DUF4415 family)